MAPKKRARITNKTTPQALIGGAGAKEQGISGWELLVGGKKVTSLPAAKWPWSCHREKLKVKGDWFQGVTEEEAKESYTCTVEGYLPEWLHGNGDKHPAYIIEVVSEPGELYPMRVGDVKRLLPRRVDTGGDDSDAEAVGREEVVDEHLTGTRRGGKQKGAAAAARRTANGPRPGDEFAEAITKVVDELHGTADDIEEVQDPESGELSSVKGRVGTGWADPVGARPHHEQCKHSKGRPKLRQAIPRKHITKASNVRDGAEASVEWSMLLSFLLCWPVTKLVSEQSSLYYDQQQEVYEASWDAEKNMYSARGKAPAASHSHFPVTEEGAGAMTEEHYLGYIAIVGFMGMVQCRDMAWHWAVNGRWAHNFVRGIMPYRMFLIFRRFLHFNDSSMKVPRGDPKQPAPAGYDMIYNFRPVMDACNVAWTALVDLAHNLTYDEQMVLLAMRSKLSRRQPNKPIRDGMQIFSLCSSCGLWCYACWIDQGRNDPALLEPYAYGWHGAIILHLVNLAGVAGTWCTVAFDQAFPAPALFMVLYMLKVYAVGTCQQNRRGFPSQQMAKYHKDNGGFSKFKVVGTAVHMFHKVTVAGVVFTLVALQWFDKNVVTMLSNKHGDEMVDYKYRMKGEVERQESVQPETREEYNATNNGVDIVDQRNASTINPHGCKFTIWHRMHDHYVNQAMHMAETHYRLVIEENGSLAQKVRVNGTDRQWHNRTTRKGGQGADELRWELLDALAAKCQVGSTTDPRVTNLRAGTPSPPPETPAAAATPAAATPASVERRQGTTCQIGHSITKGRCGMEGCTKNHCSFGCVTHGVRLCMGNGADSCMNKHLRGAGEIKKYVGDVAWK